MKLSHCFFAVYELNFPFCNRNYGFVEKQKQKHVTLQQKTRKISDCPGFKNWHGICFVYK